MSPRFSSFAHLKPRRGYRASGPRARGCERVYRRCRQFWSNICPRKNKSPLSLTTGRASLVSNRALLNRRRITDPRVARPFRLLSAPSFRSRSTSPVVESSSRPILFLLVTTERDVAVDAVGVYFIIESSRGFYRKFYRFFLSLSFFTVVTFTAVVIPPFLRVRLSVEDKRD